MTLLPLAVSLVVVWWILQNVIPIADYLQTNFSEYLPDFLDARAFYVSVVLVAFLAFVMFMGMLTRYVLGRQFIGMWDMVFSKLPLLGWVYDTVKQVLAAFNTGKSAFKEVVMIPYPHEDSWAIAFLTNEAPQKFNERTGEVMIAVFMPTTPNPTSGFLMYIPKRLVKKTDLTVDQAFKLIISTGMLSLDEVKEGKDVLDKTTPTLSQVQKKEGEEDE
ncbi:MAG: DUF502 domain-containing protein [Planctomycetota bacterium]|nr:DUF502 domain-containing protein [Planctomycetota bacterium]